MYHIFYQGNITQSVKNLPAMQETWVRFLGWEDPLDKEMAIHSSIIAWKVPWIEEPGGLQSMGSQRVGHDLATKPLPPSYLFVICPAVIGHLGYFFVLAIVNSAINIEDIGLFFKYDFLKIYAL